MPHYLKMVKPTGRWLERGDMNHDIALQIAVPEIKSGKLINVNFAAEALREWAAMVSGKPVVSPGLNKALWQQYDLYRRQHMGKEPVGVMLTNIPGYRFFAVKGTTSSRCKGAIAKSSGTGIDEMVARPFEYVMFFASPISIAI